ncbi:UDP-2,3-diacylglucosamine diphosphatase [Reichenbachiella agarivorans]|uniref:UDP-2,3-diacylglucosamine diphosphatase n=1 Tax=Reichenbachiella agarivorans TaxID=2979464 RepID=A0ABY6CQW7_9BACT|nr:UDP-2,3-diacylglucosamine diphosphatase [Reichenbachiella agarivorans]UXP32898.1 UDP-2,3-diacylglucosamine diphosphatase [Reichenbachiella agarivorans]
MDEQLTLLLPGKKIYFASDFHLGAPNHDQSFVREKKIVQWLDTIAEDAQTIFLVGDLFDFWFEYRHVVPKGYVRFLGKLAELADLGVNIVVFVGNHDLWMKDYLKDLCGATIVHEGQSLRLGDKDFYITHGDGLNPKDKKYRIIKRVFTNSVCQWLFGWFHPDLGITLAHLWSGSSREQQLGQNDDAHLVAHSRKLEKHRHHDYYVYGDCHIDRVKQINETSLYCNLGDWIDKFSYAVFDGDEFQLKRFEG